MVKKITIILLNILIIVSVSLSINAEEFLNFYYSVSGNASGDASGNVSGSASGNASGNATGNAFGYISDECSYLYKQGEMSYYFYKDGSLCINGGGYMIESMGYTNPHKIVIENYVLSVCHDAYKDCYNLESVIIGDSVLAIYDYAFYNCANLSTVLISDSVNYISENAFDESPNVIVYTYQNDYVKNYCLEHDIVCKELELVGIRINEPYKTIYSFESIENGIDLSGLQAKAIYSSDGFLIENDIPNEELTISHDTRLNDYYYYFSDIDTYKVFVEYKGFSESFEIFLLPSENILCHVENEGFDFFLFEGGTLVIFGDGILTYDTMYPVINELNRFLNEIFDFNSGKKATGGQPMEAMDYVCEIYIRGSITTIGYCGFEMLDNLYYVSIGNSVTELSSNAFYGCDGLESISGQSITRIGGYAFDGCKNLWYAFFGNVEEIYGYAFKNCTSLYSIVLSSKTSYISDNAFKGYQWQYNEIEDSYHEVENNLDITICSDNNGYVERYCKDNGFKYHNSLDFVDNKSLSGTLLENGTVRLNLKFNLYYDEGQSYILINDERVSLEELKISDSYFEFSTPAMSPKNLGDTYVINIYDENDNPLSNTISISMKDYIYALLQSPKTNDESKEFYKSLLNYASYSQEYFNHNIDDLANNLLAEDEKDVDALSYNDVKRYHPVVSGSTLGINALGQSLSLNDEISYKVYFKLTNGHYINEYKFYLDGEEAEPTKYSYNTYYIKTSKYAAPDLGINHHISVVHNENGGDLTIDSSAISYVEMVLKEENPTADDLKLAKVMKAMYYYYKNALILLGRSEDTPVKPF